MMLGCRIGQCGIDVDAFPGILGVGRSGLGGSLASVAFNGWQRLIWLLADYLFTETSMVRYLNSFTDERHSVIGVVQTAQILHTCGFGTLACDP